MKMKYAGRGHFNHHGGLYTKKGGRAQGTRRGSPKGCSEPLHKR